MDQSYGVVQVSCHHFRHTKCESYEEKPKIHPDKRPPYFVSVRASRINRSRPGFANAKKKRVREIPESPMMRFTYLSHFRMQNELEAKETKFRL